jgi:hypothetical protein
MGFCEKHVKFKSKNIFKKEIELIKKVLIFVLQTFSIMKVFQILSVLGFVFFIVCYMAKPGERIIPDNFYNLNDELNWWDT